MFTRRISSTLLGVGLFVVAVLGFYLLSLPVHSALAGSAGQSGTRASEARNNAPSGDTLVVTSTGTITATVVQTGTITVTPVLSVTPVGTVSATPTVCTINFTDVHPTDYFYADVRCVYCLGAVSGYADGTFRPFNKATRAQVAKIVVRALNIAMVTPSGTPTFKDVPPTHPFYAYIQSAAAAQIVSGYNCGAVGEPCPGAYFRPYANITRGQLSKIVVLAANHVFGWDILNPATPTFSDVPASSTFYEYIETAVCHQVISGYADGTFRPSNDAIRAQIAKIVCRVSQNLPSTCATPVPTETPGSPTATHTAVSTATSLPTLTIAATSTITGTSTATRTSTATATSTLADR